jgi:predicted RNA binding protein YcfA (HicA-like mRNA interferase family)
MPKLPGISHQTAIRVFQKSGFSIIRQGKHISMSDGQRIIIIPRANPINAYTMGGIIRDSGLSIEQFKELI